MSHMANSLINFRKQEVMAQQKNNKPPLATNHWKFI